MDALKILVGNLKGGTGKTTTAVHLAAGLAAKGHDVLLIDADPQGSATTWLVGGSDGTQLVSALEAGSLDSCLTQVSEHLWLAPSGEDLGSVAGTAPPTLLRDALANTTRKFSFVVIDAPPSVGRLISNALMASDEIVVPCECSYLALASLAQFQGVIDRIASVNPALKVSAVLPVRSTRTVHTRDAIRMLQEAYGDLVLPPVPETVAVRDAAGHQKTVFDTAPGSSAADAYRLLVDRFKPRKGRNGR